MINILLFFLVYKINFEMINISLSSALEVFHKLLQWSSNIVIEFLNILQFWV